MKFRDFVNSNAAFWISPKGQVLGFSAQKHIDSILKEPKKFGFTQKYIDNTYDKYNEPKGVEGKAREELIMTAIKKGFIRIRKYRNKYWSINVYDWNTKTKNTVISWAVDMVEAQDDPYMPVKVDSFKGVPPRNIITLRELAGLLDEKIKLIYVKSINEFMEM